MVIDPTVEANIVGQLGSMVASGKWSLQRPPADRMRGVDFYSATELVSALVKSAQTFKDTHRYLPTLSSPSSFNEHLFVRKFFAALPMPSLADKLASREYVRARLGDEVLPSVVWIGNSVDELLAAELPCGRFVLKANHGSGFNLFLNLPGDLSKNRNEIEELVTGWLGSRFGYAWGEWQYCTFKPKLFLEEFLDFEGGGTPDEYKVFCFDGKARLINFHVDRFTRHRAALYDPSWKLFPVIYGRRREIARRKRPENLADIIRVAERIADGFEFARIDLYSDHKSVIKFSEITFTPNNANERFSDLRFDVWLGRFFGSVIGDVGTVSVMNDTPDGID